MKKKFVKSLFAVGLSATMLVGIMPATGRNVQAADISGIVEAKFSIRESEIHQLLTEDLSLPTSISDINGEVITYSVGGADSRYVSVDGNKLKINRPYAGEGNYSFTLYATVEAEGDTYTKKFPMTIREGLSEDSYAGYLYCCFTDTKDENVDVQQVHFYLSEDGLNWTALNGNQPVFLTGSDYADFIQQAATGSVNYLVKKGTDVTKTVKGDASVLFPFEGDDQGIRDPYLVRGCKRDGSDSNKVWLLATDLNTHSYKYDGNTYDLATGEDADAINRSNNAKCNNFKNNICGNWGTTAQRGSTSLFVWETEDFVNWERRYIDVGSEIGAGAAWAPEAIYNPKKDNYLVYWSCRVAADGYSRNRLYCNETEDFVNFGPTKLYESEPFYANYGTSGKAGNSGYGNIDTSMLWVAEEDENGNIVDPYGTLYRLVKDETNNHIELMSSDTVLDPKVDYEASNPIRITPYGLNGTTYATVGDLVGLRDTNDVKRAEIVQNWFVNESTGNHFNYIRQTGIEQYTGAYEGATMFKFIDRDEWCVMIDFYGNMAVRYEPYTTTDLSNPNSIKKLTGGYGRTGGDIGCHGTMIPITVEEYNTLIDTYNGDPTVDNYHPLSYIQIDKRGLTDKAAELKAAAVSSLYSDGVVAQMKTLAARAEALYADKNVSSNTVYQVVKRADALLTNKKLVLPTLTDENTDIIIDAGETVADLPAVGSVHKVRGVKYKVTKVDGYNTDGTNGTVTVTGMTKKTATSVVIPSEVEIDGYTFSVNKIADKAFQSRRKLKTITIGDHVKSIGKNAFKGINRKATFKVSSDRYTAVKKLLKSKVGFKKSMKVKAV